MTRDTVFGFIALGGIALVIGTALCALWIGALTDHIPSVAGRPWSILVVGGITIALPFGLIWMFS